MFSVCFNILKTSAVWSNPMAFMKPDMRREDLISVLDFLDFWERKKKNPREWVKLLGDKEKV